MSWEVSSSIQIVKWLFARQMWTTDFIQAWNTSSALLRAIVRVEITQLLLVLLHLILPKEDSFESFCQCSIRSCPVGQSSFKPPAEATGSHISPWRSQLGLQGEVSFHLNHVGRPYILSLTGVRFGVKGGIVNNYAKIMSMNQDWN